MSFLLRMAWRDSRTSRRRLLLYVSAMTLGVAALVAIGSFRQNLRDAVDGQAKTILGADLQFEQRQPFSDRTEALIDSLGGEQAGEVQFASMVFFPTTGDTRLAQVRAIDGPFPFYGQLETTPQAAADAYARAGDVLVDQSLLSQFGIAPGDSVQIGRNRYRIAGGLDQLPGEAASAGLVTGPRVLVPADVLDQSLLNTGSRVTYVRRFRFFDNPDLESFRARYEGFFESERLRMSTPRDTEQGVGRALDNLYRFLSLTGFIALLLGAIGVASAVHVYVRQKRDTVATLRCIGASTRQAFGVYLIQAAGIGVVGAVMGALVGLLIQQVLPIILGDFLPVDVEVAPDIPSIAQGMAVGMIVTLLFALLPLLSIRKISPLRALRASVSNEDGKDPLRFVIYGLIGAGLVGFAVWLTGDWVTGFWFAAGLVAVFGLLAGTAYVLMWALRRVPLGGLPYVWRQGLANLYRPNNQTRVLVLSLGLGTFLLMTLYLTQRALIGQVEFAGIQSQANTILFDIQPTQVEGVTNIIEEQGLPLFERTPVVTMRLQRVNGRSVEALRDDSTYTGDRWPLFREYRSTYRDSLTAAETILEGDWHGNVAYDPSRPAEISIEQDIASDLGVGIGDELTFDVQGLPVQTRITSIREIDWQRLSSNFFVIFQPGVLEEAPQFFIATTRATGDEAGGRLQQAIVRAYPNVSVIDLDLILQTAEQILGRVSFVVQFMALFSIFTGLLVLLSAVAISRFQRVRESVLLRTLGASGGQVRQINGVEYLLLGMLATLTGLLLSIGGAWALARFTFDIPFSPPLMPILVAFVGVAGLTVLVGFLSSRGVSRRTPLEVLRSA